MTPEQQAKFLGDLKTDLEKEFGAWPNVMKAIERGANLNCIYFTDQDLNTLRFCVQKMLEVNKLQHGEICASILTGDYDRTEEFERVLSKLQ